MIKPYLIGVAGGSASGKTSIVEELKNAFPDDIELIGHDSYYYAQDHLTPEERTLTNYDHPDSLETAQMVKDLAVLLTGKEVERPVYDFTLHTRAEETVTVTPKPVIIVEGILVLEDKDLRELMDLRIYVDADSDERLMRRIRRDLNFRGRSLESVLTQYSNLVKPMHEKFVEPSKKYADVIIPHGAHNEIALLIIKQHISEVIKEKQNQ